MELLKIAGLQGLLPIVALVTLLKISYEKVLYVFALSDFDKLFIPQNKVKIYESIKFLLTIITSNIMFFFFSSTLSYYFDFSIDTIQKNYNIINWILSTSLLLILAVSLYVKMRYKFNKATVRGKIDDWKVMAVIYLVNIAMFISIGVNTYYQLFEFKVVNNYSISEGELLLSWTILSIIYSCFIYILILWSKNGKSKKYNYKLKNQNDKTSLYLLKCKDENTLILGDAKTNEESKSIYLYYLKEDRCVEFERVNE